MHEKYRLVEREIRRLEDTHTAPTEALCAAMEALGTAAPATGVSLASLLRRPQVSYSDLAPFDPSRPALPRDVTEQAEISIKYEGYIKRQLRQVEEFAKMEERPIPPDTDYSHIDGLRLEARQKLAKIKPENFGRASRISGVSPADVAALMVWLESKRGGAQ